MNGCKKGGKRRRSTRIRKSQKRIQKKRRGSRKKRGGGLDLWGMGTTEIGNSAMKRGGGDNSAYTRLPVDIKRDPYLI